MSVDKRSNVSLEGSDAAIDAAPDLPIGEEREEALDPVEPTMSGPVGRATPPAASQFLIVIVHDEMDVEFTRHGSLDLVKELAELDSTAVFIALADGPSARNIKAPLNDVVPGLASFGSPDGPDAGTGGPHKTASKDPRSIEVLVDPTDLPDQI